MRLRLKGRSPLVERGGYVAASGSRKLATVYPELLFSPRGEQTVVGHAFRPPDESVLQKFRSRFPAIKTFSVERALGSWAEVQAKHFADGAIYDQIVVKR